MLMLNLGLASWDLYANDGLLASMSLLKNDQRTRRKIGNRISHLSGPVALMSPSVTEPAVAVLDELLDKLLFLAVSGDGVLCIRAF